MHTTITRKFCLRVIPFFQYLLPLGICQDRQIGDPLIRVRGDPIQQSLEMSQQTTNGCRVEKIGLIFGEPSQPFIGFRQIQCQVCVSVNIPAEPKRPNA